MGKRKKKRLRDQTSATVFVNCYSETVIKIIRKKIIEIDDLVDCLILSLV